MTEDHGDDHWESRELQKDMRWLRQERERSESMRKTRLTVIVQGGLSVLSAVAGGVVSYWIAVRTGVKP